MVDAKANGQLFAHFDRSGQIAATFPLLKPQDRCLAKRGNLPIITAKWIQVGPGFRELGPSAMIILRALNRYYANPIRSLQPGISSHNRF